MSVTYLTTPIVEVRNDPPPHGSGMTREGYTKLSGAPTARMIRLQGEKRWRRLMVWQFSNMGTMFVKIAGTPHVVRQEDLPAEGAKVQHATKKTSNQGRWDDSPGAWQRGYDFAKESILHETRAEQREILQRVAKSASSSYDFGFLAAYQDELDVPRSRAHATKKSPAQLNREIAHALAKNKTSAPCCAHAGRPGHRAHATRAGSGDEGPRGPSGKQTSQAAKRANDQIYDLVNNKYFQSIPNDQLFKIVKGAGFRFDPEEEEFFLVGRDGNASWHLRDVSGRPVNHMLVLQWHTDGSDWPLAMKSSLTSAESMRALAAADAIVAYETVETSMDFVMLNTRNAGTQPPDIDLGPAWPATTLLLRGLALSTERWENGLVEWIDDLANALADDAVGRIRYYQIELGTGV